MGGLVYMDPDWTSRLPGWNGPLLETAHGSVGAGVVMSRFKCVSKGKIFQEGKHISQLLPCNAA